MREAVIVSTARTPIGKAYRGAYNNTQGQEIAGHAIAHAERTPTDNTGRLNGVQLWTALPDRDRHGAPSFQHVTLAPTLEAGDVAAVFFEGVHRTLFTRATWLGDGSRLLLGLGGFLDLFLAGFPIGALDRVDRQLGI